MNYVCIYMEGWMSRRWMVGESVPNRKIAASGPSGAWMDENMSMCVCIFMYGCVD
jgi:hypothetical protein